MKQASFKFRKGMSVGDIAAEYDELLFDTFLDTGDIEILENTNNPKTVIVGRTGAGKTALITMLERRKERVLRINPENLSMHYLTNTTIIPALVEMGVHLEPFFQLLWRFVLVMELIRDYFKLRDEEGQRSFFNRLGDLFTRKSHREALDYFSQWNPSFWESSDVRVRQITKAFEEKMGAKLGQAFASAAASTGRSEQVKSEEVQRAHAVVREISMEQLSVGMDIVRSKVLADRQKPYYIVIDDLDKNWVDSELAYSLVETLLDVVGDFARMDNVKIVVALRENIVEALHHRRGRQRQQREKHESLFLRLRWSDSDLTALLDARLKKVLRKEAPAKEHPSHEQRFISLGELLPETRGRQEISGVDFMMARTFRRPRDLIDFVNRSIQVAAEKGANRITWQILKDAERLYSIGRLKSLEDEWYDTYPDIGVVFRAFDQVHNGFSVAEIEDDRLTDILIAGERAPEPQSIAKAAYDMDRKGRGIREIWMELAVYLYRVGFFGAKVSTQAPILYAYETGAVATDQLTYDSRFYVHPAVRRALNIAEDRPAN